MIIVDCELCRKTIKTGRERMRMEIRAGAGRGRICDKCARSRKKKVDKKVMA